MTTAFLQLDLETDEGFREVAYPDPISHGAPWTIGFGDTHGVKPGMTTTRGAALVKLAQNINAVCAELDAALPWWRRLCDPRQDCLANQAFNMGVAKLQSFTTYLGLVKEGRYAEAAADELHTLWAHQVGKRAQRLARQMQTGTRPS